MASIRSSKLLSGAKGLRGASGESRIVLAARVKDTATRLAGFANINATLLGLAASEAETLEDYREFSGPLAVAEEIQSLAARLLSDSSTLLAAERKA